VPVALIPFWRLRQHAVSEEAVRGGSRRRALDRSWPLPDAVKDRLRPVLEPLGFDLDHAVSVSEPAGQDALQFTQPDVDV
jgi:hypothetical protein